MSQIFNIQLETDLSEFDSVITDSGDLSQSSAAALAGTTGGLSCLIDDTTLIYGQKDFTQITTQHYRFRFYIDVHTLNVESYHGICLFRASGNNRMVFRLDSNQRGYLRYGTDPGTWFSTLIADISTGEHFIEVLVQYASSAVASDAVVTFWVDGVQIDQDTGRDIYNLTKPDEVQFGAPEVVGNTAGTYYLDEFVLRDDDTEIGPVAAGGFAVIF